MATDRCTPVKRSQKRSRWSSAHSEKLPKLDAALPVKLCWVTHWCRQLLCLIHECIEVTTTKGSVTEIDQVFEFIHLGINFSQPWKKTQLYQFIRSSPWAVTISWQHSYVHKVTYKPSKLGQTDLVFGLWP